ncbi:hypothetical protein BHU72_03175 [Desulfuribacillus stibiiarsenatis]|uniref:Fluoride-specific ion channel FluC n=1 Tax=Desulfuribacillus stibiiarsenatis TaxID=1390249 RepID=A0A1E5L6K6_9FIRM|nr:fluoride efflux transporter CrcB [Desulfuribacillus stibiiarsenatis]OEH85797.1 hypothetical protein BHU72_03175 [Desulfuribacillus stibiiarsenatis]
MFNIEHFIIVSIAGAFGALSRYQLGLFIMNRYPTPRIPIAIILINVLGSFLLGLLASYHEHNPDFLSQTVYIGLAIGFLGSFTTFSTFSVEAIQLWEQKAYRKMIAYLIITILMSIFGFLFGYFVA